MNRFILLLFISTGFYLISIQKVSAQETYDKSKFDKVLPGLNESQVREIVGVPSRVEPFYIIKNNTTDTSTFWVYPNLYTVAFRNHYVEYVERNRMNFLQRVQTWNNPGNPDGVRLKHKHVR